MEMDEQIFEDKKKLRESRDLVKGHSKILFAIGEL